MVLHQLHPEGHLPLPVDGRAVLRPPLRRSDHDPQSPGGSGLSIRRCHALRKKPRLLLLRRYPKFAAKISKVSSLPSPATVLSQGSDPRNGTLIISNLLSKNYFSALGYNVFMDENGDAEGNYTLVALEEEDGVLGQRGKISQIFFCVINSPLRRTLPFRKLCHGLFERERSAHFEPDEEHNLAQGTPAAGSAEMRISCKCAQNQCDLFSSLANF